MGQYIHLIGAEDVVRAGHNMAGASEVMSRAAQSIDCSVDRLIHNLNDFMFRFEQAIERLEKLNGSEV